jgi:hypothetical protein
MLQMRKKSYRRSFEAAKRMNMGDSFDATHSISRIT